ncbi:uncharacterized protein CXQ87_004697 [Candidozyma duobushaemuli]|uniref:Major facilitator superfamily (MFS) profile domain-containing protein n=2 Tax=Candidozyma TaxID=3303203 RepID=A0ABX8IDM0_9ASCO|nr:uncharacterized protein CXQ87_004697 [[Candida] duobushaemulonis]PVH16406.1 hypothetical protein CXQ87_004697 [[Candida] duobushaemulonis]QWU90177.1 hypothetical protein CA3LBN_004538 [[Candida] haemuloni]
MGFSAYEDRMVKPALAFRNFLDGGPKITNIYFIACISCISGLMFGFDISSMSAFLGQDAYLRFFDSPGSDMQGFITASMSLGSFFGAMTTSFISEPFGRRASLMVCSLFWMIGAAIQSSSQNRPQLIIGRFISGAGIGFGSSVAPVYGSELSPRKVRGFIGGMFQTSVTLGILVMFYICFGCSHIDGVASFRIAWAIQIVPGLILFFGLFFIPESPRWLAKQGYWDEAETIVAQINAKGNREDPDVMIEISEIKDQLIVEENVKGFTFVHLFSKKYLPRTIVAVFAQIWQQLTGMNVMMYYIVYVFEMAGISGNANLVSSSIQYVLNFGCTVVALFLMDKIGRRPLLLGGAAMMAAWQFAVAGLLGSYSVPYPDSGKESVTIKIPDDEKPAANGVIASCYLFVCSFAVSWGVVVWVYCSEMWGDSVSRQRGAALATAANWIFNFAIAMFTPPSFANINWRTYIIYASFCVAMFVHVLFFFPETKGKRLEEIDQIWTHKIPAWKSASYVPAVPILPGETDDKIATEHHDGVLRHSSSNSDPEKDASVANQA